jgi:hypothetical protein
VRGFAWAFLAVLLATASLGIEAWPFTAFRLFSHVRSGTVAGWEVVAVESGAEVPVDLASLGRGFRGGDWVLARFGSMTARERADVCAAWEEALADAGRVVSDVRIYRTARSVRTDFDRPPPPVTRTLRYSCDTLQP